MIIFKNIPEFKDFDKFGDVLKKSKTEPGRFGGLKVKVEVTVRDHTRTILVSRNQLAQLALALAKDKEKTQDVQSKFAALRGELSTLDNIRSESTFATRLGNSLFKLFHLGKDRKTLLRNELTRLQLLNNDSSSESLEINEDNPEQLDDSFESCEHSDTSESSEIKDNNPVQHEDSFEGWEPPEDEDAPRDLEKWMKWLAKNRPDAFK